MAAPTTVELERILIRLVGDNLEYIKMLNESLGKTQKFASEVESQIQRIGRAFSGLATTVGAPLGMMAKLGVEAFAKFDDKMTQSTSIMSKVSDEQKKALTSLALKLSTTSRQGPAELAEAYYFLTSAGMSAEQSMRALPQVTAFATAGMFRLDEATDRAMGSLASLGLMVDDPEQNLKNLTRVTDVLVKANELAIGSTRDFAVALTTQSGPAIRAFGKEIEEGVALLAVLHQRGMKGEVAGHAVARAMRLMSTTANKNAAAFKELGIDIYDPMTGKMRHMASIVRDLDKAFAKMSPQTKSAALEFLGFETRVQTAVMPILGTSEAMKGFYNQLKAVKGTTQEVASKQLKSFVSQMMMVKNTITVASITIGQELAPMLLMINHGIAGLAQMFVNIDPDIRRFITKSTVLTGTLVTLAGSFVLARTASAMLFSGLGSLPFIILGISAAAAMAVNGIIEYFGGIDKLSAAVIDNLPRMKQMLINIYDTFKMYGRKIFGDSFDYFVVALGEVGYIVQQVILGAIYLYKNFGKVIVDVAVFAWAMFSKAVMIAWNLAVKFVETYGQQILDIITAVGEGIVGLWITVKNAVVEVWDSISTEVKAFAGMITIIMVAATVAMVKAMNFLTLERIRDEVANAFIFIRLQIDKLKDAIVGFVGAHKGMVFALLSIATVLLRTYLLIKTVIIAWGIFKALLVTLKIQQIASALLWVVWTTALIAAKIAVITFNIILGITNAAIGLYDILAGTATVSTGGLTAAIAALTAAMTTANIVAFVGTVFVLGAALTAAAIATYGLYVAIVSTYNVIADAFNQSVSRSEDLSNPFSKVLSVLDGWQTALKNITIALKSDVPLAVDIIYAYLNVVKERIIHVGPPLIKFFETAAKIIGGNFAIQFEKGVGKGILEATRLLKNSIFWPGKLGAKLLGFTGADIADNFIDEWERSIDLDQKKFAGLSTKLLKRSMDALRESTKGSTEEIKKAEAALTALYEKTEVLEARDVFAKWGEVLLDTRIGKMVRTLTGVGKEGGWSPFKSTITDVDKLREELGGDEFDWEEVGKDDGKAYGAGFTKGARVDNVLFRSAEAVRRIEDQMDLFRLGAAISKKDKRRSKADIFHEMQRKDVERAKRGVKIGVLGEGDERGERAAKVAVDVLDVVKKVMGGGRSPADKTTTGSKKELAENALVGWKEALGPLSDDIAKYTNTLLIFTKTMFKAGSVTNPWEDPRWRGEESTELEIARKKLLEVAGEEAQIIAKLKKTDWTIGEVLGETTDREHEQIMRSKDMAETVARIIMERRAALGAKGDVGEAGEAGVPGSVEAEASLKLKDTLTAMTSFLYKIGATAFSPRETTRVAEVRERTSTDRADRARADGGAGKGPEAYIDQHESYKTMVRIEKTLVKLTDIETQHMKRTLDADMAQRMLMVDLIARVGLKEAKIKDA